jgi:hypothetical protein
VKLEDSRLVCTERTYIEDIPKKSTDENILTQEDVTGEWIKLHDEFENM